MEEHHLEIRKTARITTVGRLTESTTKILIVLHGHGHLTRYFARKFEGLNDSHFLVFPEGLHRYYLNGYSGKVGATWMTKEDRLNDIKDYINYLDIVYKHFKLNSYAKAKINLLGFSQGVSTGLRWLINKNSRIDSAIFWAGSLPPEIDYIKHSHFLNRLNIQYAYSSNDEFISMDTFKEYWKMFKEANIKFRKIEYEGTHDINESTLIDLLKYSDKNLSL